MKLSIIIPVLNEAACIDTTLDTIRDQVKQKHEIVVVDGGSTDNTVESARNKSDLVLSSPKGRAAQMNTGAASAKGDCLLFLHADTLLPENALSHIEKAIVSGKRWGRFDVRLSGSHFLFRVIEIFMNLRSRLTSIATGDQAIFITRDLFDELGGFPDMPLMEDIAMSKNLKKKYPPACIRDQVVTSSRRWEERGIIKTILLMWRLRLLFFFGASPEYLAKQYR